MIKCFKVNVKANVVLYRKQFGVTKIFFTQADSKDLAIEVCLHDFNLDKGLVVSGENIDSNLIGLSKPEDFDPEEISLEEFNQAVRKIGSLDISGTSYWFKR